MQNLHALCFKVGRWVSVILLALLPVAVIPVDWITVTQSKGLLIGISFVVLVIVWVLASVAEGFIRIPKHALPIAVALLPIAYATSAFVSGASWNSYVGNGASVDTVSSVAIFYGIFLIVASLYSTHSVVSLLRAFLVGGSILLFLQGARLFVSSGWFDFNGALTGVATSSAGSWHDLGITLALLMFLSMLIARTITKGRSMSVILYGLAFLAGVLLIVVNLSDVWFGVAGLFAAYAVYLAVSYWKQESWRALCLRTYVYLCIALVAIGFGYAGGSVQTWLPESARVVHVEVRPSWQGTFAVGEKALSGKGLWFGTGPNTFVREWSLYKPKEVNITNFWGTDFYAGIGTVPTSVVTVGLFGALAWIVIIFALCAIAYRGRSIREDPLLAILFIGTLFLTVFQILYTPGVALSLFTFLLYAILLAHHSRDSSPWHLSIDVVSIRGGITLAVLCVVSLSVLFLSIQSLRFLVSDILLSRGERALAKTGDTAVAASYVQWASVLFPNNDRAHRAAVELGFIELRALASRGAETEEKQQQLQNVLSQTIGRGLSAVSAENNNYQNWLLLARLYGELAGSKIEGAETQAREAYARARAVNPTSPLPIVGLAQLEIVLGNMDAARKLLFEALLLKPNLSVAYFLLSRIDAGEGNFDTARESALAVVELTPEDALSWYNLGAVLYGNKEWGGAIEALTRALALQTNYADALFVLGLSYFEAGEKEKAITAFTALSSLDPTQEVSSRALKNIRDGFDPLRKRTR